MRSCDGEGFFLTQSKFNDDKVSLNTSDVLIDILNTRE